MNAPANQATVSEMRALSAAPRELQMPDQKIDMFSLRGFELAQRIAKAFATSDAVPAQFRAMVEKKSRDGSTWTENPAALGNCLVAIETARAVGMSITAVMQNANIIEGKLSWSAQFVIASINASGRFTPLRFDIKSRGPIKAKYREKLGWNNNKKGFDFEERTVDIEDLVCIAWALPAGFAMPKGVYTLQQCRDAGLPLIESSPVSMKMAVEEGWYSKPGSKWQTEMRHQMLQYRSGAFFGRIHAPDIVMGMGRTTEELIDMTTIDMTPDGRVASVTTEELRRPSGAAPAEVVQQVNEVASAAVDSDTGEITPEASKAAAKPEVAAASAALAFDADAFADRLDNCKDLDALDLMADEIRSVPNKDAAEVLTDIYKRRRDELQSRASEPAASAPAQPAARRARGPQASME